MGQLIPLFAQKPDSRFSPERLRFRRSTRAFRISSALAMWAVAAAAGRVPPPASTDRPFIRIQPKLQYSQRRSPEGWSLFRPALPDLKAFQEGRWKEALLSFEQTFCVVPEPALQAWIEAPLPKASGLSGSIRLWVLKAVRALNQEADSTPEARRELREILRNCKVVQWIAWEEFGPEVHDGVSAPLGFSEKWEEFTHAILQTSDPGQEWARSAVELLERFPHTFEESLSQLLQNGWTDHLQARKRELVQRARQDPEAKRQVERLNAFASFRALRPPAPRRGPGWVNGRRIGMGMAVRGAYKPEIRERLLFQSRDWDYRLRLRSVPHESNIWRGGLMSMLGNRHFQVEVELVISQEGLPGRWNLLSFELLPGDTALQLSGKPSRETIQQLVMERLGNFLAQVRFEPMEILGYPVESRCIYSLEMKVEVSYSEFGSQTHFPMLRSAYRTPRAEDYERLWELPGPGGWEGE